jgi:opacity protein-like surface antigen
MRMTSHWVAIVSLFAVAASASAQQNPEAAAAQEHRWNLQFLASAAADVTNRDVQLYGPTLAIGYHQTRNLSWNLELAGHWIEQDEDTFGGSAAVVLRQSLLDVGRGRVFIDVGGGLFRAADRVPEGGTHNNFTFHFGTGMLYPLGQDVDLILGLRYFHLSNAHRKGEERNPGLNGPLGFIGLQFML